MTATPSEAADELAARGIEAEIVDPRTLRPLDVPTIIESVKKTSRLVIAHEGWKRAGFGAEVSAAVAEEAIDWLKGARFKKRQGRSAAEGETRAGRRADVRRHEARGGRPHQYAGAGRGAAAEKCRPDRHRILRPAV